MKRILAVLIVVLMVVMALNACSAGCKCKTWQPDKQQGALDEK